MNEMPEFNLGRYREILVKALEKGFSFQTFSNYIKRPASKVVLLRHDVDVSIEWALELAEVEHQLGIQSTFFIRLHSIFYNPIEDANIKRMNRLSQMGFEIGIHQELWKFTNDMQSAVELLRSERRLMEILLQREILGVATHLPNWNTFRMNPEFLSATGFSYRPGNGAFNEGALFVSDSNSRWKSFSLEEAIERADKVLANIHPVWWVQKVDDTAELIELLREGK